MDIESGRIINDFIEPNKKQYAIPVYQRNYEWSKEQCEKLFEDIVLAYQKDRNHFCGMIVYALLKEEHNITYYVIIDGQQRLTTIYLIIKALKDLAKTNAEKEQMEEVLINTDKYDKYAIDLASKLKLKPIKSDNQQLSLLMENKFDEIDQTSGLWHNYELFKELISKRQEDGMTVKDIYRGLEKLRCAKIKLASEDNAQEIFERINSTGVPLSLADKIRNFVLMTDVNQEKLFEEYWLKIEQLIKKEDVKGFFLDYLNLKIEGFVREDKAYDEFKNVYYDSGYDNESILKEIRHYAVFYHVFLYGDSKYSDEVNRILTGLQKVKQTTLFLFLFRVFDDYEKEVIDQKILEKVLGFLLNYSIRRLVCEIGSNSLRGLYKTLYSRVFSHAEHKENYFDAIVSFFMQITTKDQFPGDNIFMDSLKQKNLYRKYALCRYLLCEIENRGKEKVLTGNLTVEHILPQNKNLSSSWQEMLGKERWKEDREKLLHSLGNLTLTAYNSELGDKPFKEKKKMFNELAKVTTLNTDVKDSDVWDADAINRRADRLTKIVLEIYPHVEPNTEISFNDPRFQEYNCDPQTATNKTPNYYVLQGERVNVTTFAEMLRSIIKQLYEYDSTPIEKMARVNEKILSGSQNIMFSYDRKKVSERSIKIDGTDIFENVGFSASYIMYIIRAILEKYDIDEEEFVYSARTNKLT
jgi:uncharacterized protein with ParB-like and HNH nuclease domain